MSALPYNLIVIILYQANVVSTTSSCEQGDTVLLQKLLFIADHLTSGILVVQF